MGGTIQIQSEGAPTETPAGEAETITGETVSLKSVAPDAPCDKQIPAIVTREIVGGPTIADYVASCDTSTATAERAPHAADYAIPISFALVALGIAGLVWVHKSYKP
jgi:hypothetical protein